MWKNSSGFRPSTVDCGCYVAAGRRAEARIQDSGETRPRHTCRRPEQFSVLDSYRQTLCRVVARIFAVSPFSTFDSRPSTASGERRISNPFGFLPPNSVQVVARIFAVSPFSTLDLRLPHEGGEFQIRLARFWISDCFHPGRAAYCLLPTALLESWMPQRSRESSSLSFLAQARNMTNCLHWQAAGFA